MAFKVLACLVSLLVLPIAGPTMPALAAEAGTPGKGEANWDRDLFAIFREGAEPDEEETAESETDWEIVPTETTPVETSPEPALPELKLRGIVIAGERAAALVDGKIVRPGEEIAGWTVSRIDAHALVVVGPEGEKEYQLLAGGGRARVSSQAIPAPE